MRYAAAKTVECDLNCPSSVPQSCWRFGMSVVGRRVLLVGATGALVAPPALAIRSDRSKQRGLWQHAMR